MTALSLNGIAIANKLTYAGNLVCALNSNYISSLSSSLLTANIATLKLVSNSDCPSLQNLYTAVKKAYNLTSLTSSYAAEFGGLIGGISVSDLTSMSSEVFLSFTYQACKNMPASTVNSIPANVLSLSSTSQLAAFVNSPQYSNYSTTIKSALASLIAGKSSVNYTLTTSAASLHQYSSASSLINMLVAVITVAIFQAN